VIMYISYGKFRMSFNITVNSLVLNGYIFRSGSCRIIKSVKFLKVFVSREKYQLVPLDDDSDKITTANPNHIITKYVIVQHLNAGDHFYDGHMFRSARDLIMDSGLPKSTSLTSLVTEFKSDLVRMTKLDLNKFATKITWRTYAQHNTVLAQPLHQISEAYIDKREWELAKKKVVEEIIRAIKRRKQLQLKIF
jgi:hypothetical protein